MGFLYGSRDRKVSTVSSLQNLQVKSYSQEPAKPLRDSVTKCGASTSIQVSSHNAGYPSFLCSPLFSHFRTSQALIVKII